MSVILIPFSKLLLLLYDWTSSYGVALILFCLIIRAILFPLFLKGRKSMLAMSGLAEQQKVLQQKYARDREKYSAELQKLYEREGVKPSGGCLWSFLPLVVLIPLYGIVSKPLKNLLGMSEDQFNTVANIIYGSQAADMSYSTSQLSMAQDVFLNYDKIVSAVPELAGMPQIDFTFLGMNLAETPSLFFWQQENVAMAFGLWIIPVLAAALNVVSMFVTNKINAHITGISRGMDSTNRTMMIMMPLISLWICFTLPAALGLYWVANSVIAMISEFANIPFLKKHTKKLAEEKAKRAEFEKERAKKERIAQAEAKKKNQEEMRRIQMERKLNKNLATASREGLRTYARGRLYDPDRYPTYPYVDPNEAVKKPEEQESKEEEKVLPAEEAAPAAALPDVPEVQETASEAVSEEVVSPEAAEAAEETEAEPEAQVDVPEAQESQEEASSQDKQEEKAEG